MNLSLTDITMPYSAAKAVEMLSEAGFEAFAVGGCVRDALLGKMPDDWDVTTSALPEETKAVFDGFHIIDTGIKHGTVTVRIEHESVEITTYRTDGEYEDHRHPESVIFSRHLADDLSRRDFTVNAMCYAPDKGIVDFFDGKSDLENGIIRCVGDAEKRFDEDALRILRGLRFAAVLGFSVEEKTAQAIHKLKGLLNSISAERVYVEFKKMLTNLKKPEILIEFRDVMETVFPSLISVSDEDYRTACENAVKFTEMPLSLAAFLAPLTEEEIEAVFRFLKADRKTRDFVLFLCKNKETGLTCSGDVLRMLSESDRIYMKGLKDFRKVLCFDKTVDAAFTEAFLRAEGGVPATTKELAINGRVISELGFKGPEIGNISARLLHATWYEGLENNEKSLVDYIKANFGTHLT